MRSTSHAGLPAALRPASLPAALALSFALAACGGGTSTSDLPPPPVPAPQVCTATDSGGAGFALGVCATSVTSAFQPVETIVVPTESPSYGFQLTFPASLPENLSTSLNFTSANRTPVGTRDVVGELRGAAYEADADAATDPSNLNLTPPYSALIDFGQAWLYSQAVPSDSNTLQTMSYAGFGVWERFAEANFDDGYFGVWYSPLAVASALDQRPTALGERVYTGVAVGVISPAAPGGLYSRSYGFSATVAISVNGPAGITGGTISSLKIATAGTGTNLTIESVPLKDLAFSAMDNFVGQPQTGSLVTSTGTGADATGVVEARYFGSNISPAEVGREIAGRFRFQTTDGSLRGVGSFGVRAPSP